MPRVKEAMSGEGKIKLKSISKEAEACRKAFSGVEVGCMVVHCHHEKLAEKLTEPAGERITYILTQKPKSERALWLRLFRPIPKPLYDNYWSRRKPLDDDYEAKLKPLYDDYWSRRKSLYDDYLAKRKPLDDDYWSRRKPLDDDYLAKLKSLHKKICKVKGCPWNGQTIFP